MRTGLIARLAVVLGLATTAASGALAHGAGAGAAGSPMGIGVGGLSIGTHGPLNLPGPAESMGHNSNFSNPGAQDPRARTQASSRREQARELWRSHRDQLDFDPQHQLVVRSEIVAFAPTDATVARAATEGFVVRRRLALSALDGDVAIFEGPAGMSLRQALDRLRALDPDGVYDYNHVYFASAVPEAPAVVAGAFERTPANHGTEATGATHRIGLVDGGVEANHPALLGTVVHAHGCQGAVVPSVHGTAVASLLTRATREGAAGATSAAELYSADVYCGAPTGGSVDALLEALEWMVREHVPVINVSLVGPPNALLQRAVRLVTERGHLIVAAVGNDGPAAPPLYPAAYPDAIAVTAVDRNDRVLMEAERGPYVHFAAPGADVNAANLPAGSLPVRGTSFAAPVVAWQLAVRIDHPDRQQAQRAVRELEGAAIDLGAPGFDPVYGYGCIGCGTSGSPAAASRER